MPEPPKRTVAKGVAPAGGADSASASRPEVERRIDTRFPISVAAEVVEPRSNAKVAGRTTDLGIGGCYVDALNPYPVGTPVNLRLTQDNRSFRTHAMVVYAHTGMGMGLAFTEVSDDQMETLQDWMRELSGGATLSFETPELPGTKPRLGQTERHVLNDLISLLMRKGTLTEAEAAALQRELFR